MSRTILVFGSTGPQGGGVVKALSSANARSEGQFTVLAVTRDVNSDAAKQLADLPGVEPIKYETGDVGRLFREARAVHAVFMVQSAFQDDEVKEASGILAACAEHGIRQLIYTGAELQGQDPTPIPYFETKRRIEQLIRLGKWDADFIWTILRPARFNDNWLRADYIPVNSVVVDAKKKYHCVSGDDMGAAALAILQSPRDFRGRTISLASDALTIHEQMAAINEVWGKTLTPMRLQDVPADFRDTAKFNAGFPYQADIEQCRKMFLGLQDFRAWLARHAAEGKAVGK